MNISVNLFLLAATIFMEAENQSPTGKLAVGYVVMNRATSQKRTVTRVVLQPWQWSCWNTDSPTRKRLAEAVESEPRAWLESMAAAANAFFGIEPDPTNGADHYLNVKAVGKLPTWYNKNFVVARIGDHEFLKL